MDYSIAICDDNNVDIDYIHNLVNAWSKVYEYTLDISTFTSAESFLFDYCKDKNYDILLLDIEMTGLDGVSLAKEVRKSNQTVQIIFVTGYSEYISEGYEVSALHY
ncbi:MAG: response regulator, partial [Oscillospiraceae bacterium]